MTAAARSDRPRFVRSPVLAFVLTEITAELALLAAVGYLLFAIDDFAVDAIYFARCAWKQMPSAEEMATRHCTGWVAVFIPA